MTAAAMEMTQFEFIKVIYENTNSLIVKARHQPSGQAYIIKTCVAQADAKDLLQNEYELTQDISQNNIVENLAIIPNGVNLAIIQKDIDAQSLKNILDKAPLPLDIFFVYAIQIVKAIAFIHEKGIIHQDINPSNILLESNGNIRLIDFGISVRLERKYTEISGINQLRGTLQYISPEQTGRMNRVIDYRSDYYSLGITFFEMLAGKVPFEAADQMELVYAQIANPLPKDKNIPQVLWLLLDKLTQKNAEQRYQSAAGILADLEFLQKAYQENQDIENITFEAGQNDFSPKLQIPQKLYGREAQRKLLLDNFEQVHQYSQAQLCLVKGYSGVGKSALINEIQKPITQKRGYFISGKFDQFQRNVPYMALLIALDKLIEQILTEEAVALARWKNEFLSAFGTSGKVLTDLLPSLELIIGKQPEVEELASSENQNRLIYLLANFVEVIAQKDHPVVLFIDDLQWADLATLQLLQKILQTPQDLHLLVIGAYRDNEVDEAHPLVMTLAEIKKAGTSIQEILLGNLSHKNIEDLVVDTLSNNPDLVQDLVELVKNKTQGNAFFVNRFINNLYEDGFLFLENSSKKWVWDISKIQAQNITDNVVEFLSKQLIKLPQESIRLLQLGAVVGNSFELEMLEKITQEDSLSIRKALAVAEQQQFISKNNNTYRFQHDRLQQATYLSLDAQKRLVFHLQIAQYFRQDTEKNIFELVYHLYQAYDILDNSQKKELLRLHIEAGKKALQSVAYTSAKIYLDRALADLPAQAWEQDYELCCSLYENLVESEFLNGDIENSQKIAYQFIDQLKTDTEKAQVFNMLIMQQSTLGKFREAVELGTKTLSILGYPLPSADKLEAATGEAIGTIMQTLGSRKVLDIFYQPDAQEPAAKLAIALRAGLAPACYLLGENKLWAYLITSGTALSLQKGNVLESCTLYSSFGILCGAIFGDNNMGYDYGQLALNLSQKYNNQRMKATVLFVIATFLHSWVKPKNTLNAIFEEGTQAAVLSGEKFFGGTLIGQGFMDYLTLDTTILSAIEKIQHLRKLALKVQSVPALYYLCTGEIYINPLTKKNPESLLLFPDNQNEAYYMDFFAKENPFMWAWANLFKHRACFILEQWEESRSFMLQAESFVVTLIGSTYEIMWRCYSFIFESYFMILGISKPDQITEGLEANFQKLEKMATLNPHNFERYYKFAQGMKAWQNQDYIAAMRIFEEALEYTNASGSLQDIAIFNELVARFYKAIGNKRLHEIYIVEAYSAYKKWYAPVKVEQMERQYAFLSIQKSLDHSIYTSINTTLHTQRESSTKGYASRLDTISLSKATQSIMGEVVLEKLLEKLLKIVLENAGAQRGILLLPKDDDLLIEAIIDQQSTQLMQSLSLQSQKAQSLVPQKLINYVQRSQKSLVLDNASQENNMIDNNYLQIYQTQSLLCMPLLNQGKITAILYLENNLVTGAFTEERLTTLNILSTQIAIAIDNALLYANLEKQVQKRTSELNKSNQKLQVILKEVEKQREIITEKNNDIIASINYASRIQQAILPFHERIEKAIGQNNLFVLYMPRDIVSGDFYFFENIHEQQKNLSFFAVADCTGHGIPGAFMSMIGNQLLHEIILRNRIYEAHLILENLNDGVRQALKQDQTENNDGMDISIIVLHKEKDATQYHQMDYAGAMNPLYYVEFEQENKQLFEIKATKRAIGGRQKENAMPFQSHNIALKNPTTVYLATDGFQDQFGGADNRKFLTKRFRELLFDNAHLSLEEQKNSLENTIKNWIGDYHQTDDITVVGFQLNF